MPGEASACASVFRPCEGLLHGLAGWRRDERLGDCGGKGQKRIAKSARERWKVDKNTKDTLAQEAAQRASRQARGRRQEKAQHNKRRARIELRDREQEWMVMRTSGGCCC